MSLCRAFVFLPREWSQLGERTVFFEAPFGVKPWEHLEKLLALAWNVDTAGWGDDGLIYNTATERDLLAEHAFGGPATGDLQLLETGSGGEVTLGVIPPGAAEPGIAIHYARMADVDLFVTPRNAARLRKALSTVEALYAIRGLKARP